MNRIDSSTPGEPTGSVATIPCPTGCLATCSLRKAAVDIASGRRGAKDSLTRCEVEGFLSLKPGHRIVAWDHETGEVWHGAVDVPFPELGFVWVFADLGERKLLDISVHTVWRSDTSDVCGHGAKKLATVSVQSATKKYPVNCVCLPHFLDMQGTHRPADSGIKARRWGCPEPR
jgi:hypothetical protein